MWSAETIKMFTDLSAVLAPVATALVTGVFLWVCHLYAKAKKVEISASTIEAGKSMAKQVVLYVQEQFDQWVKSKGEAPGPTNGAEKKALAMQLMKEQAPPGLKISESQASVAIDAAVQEQRQASGAPPPLVIDAQGTIYKSIKPGAPPMPSDVEVSP
jgi:hypothetical protein